MAIEDLISDVAGRCRCSGCPECERGCIRPRQARHHYCLWCNRRRALDWYHKHKNEDPEIREARRIEKRARRAARKEVDAQLRDAQKLAKQRRALLIVANLLPPEGKQRRS